MYRYDHRAIYIFCDASMVYDSNNSGGIGYIIKFPEELNIEPISGSIGIYQGANIERLEMEGLISGIERMIKEYENYREELGNVSQIVVITDRYALQDEIRTSPYKIREWRRNKWKNHEGKPIKNSDLLDKLDKKRKKLSNSSWKKIRIEYRPRKQNKEADKLSKKARKEGLPNASIAIKGIKIGKRKYDGISINYSKIFVKDELHIHIFKKDPVGDEWEVNAEICSGAHIGKKLKLYCDDVLASKLKRRNEFIVRIKKVNIFHIRIYKTLKKPKNNFT